MSFFQWLLLGSVLGIYLLFGGSVFMFIEQANELHQQAELKLLRKEIREMEDEMDRNEMTLESKASMRSDSEFRVYNRYSGAGLRSSWKRNCKAEMEQQWLIQDLLLGGLDEKFYNKGTLPEILEAVRQAKEGVILRISETCGGKNLLDVNSSQHSAPLRWTLYNSVFYAFTAITTIGYGNLAPSTDWSRIFTIFYALIGIPINGIILTKISDMYNRKLKNIQNLAKATESRITFAFNVIFYLIPGLLLFIIIPAAFFVIIENWGYLDAIYFCFVSLTTIGFGDIYPVAGMGEGHGVWLWVYKITIIFWIVFGLGYLVMILGFITKGITSKQVRGALEKKLNQIRITREKLAKDVDYMRKVVNEIYLSNAETGGFIYDHPSDMTLDMDSAGGQQYIFQRSKSFYIPRGSFSGEVDISLIRSFSESDLDRFSNTLKENVGKMEKNEGVAEKERFLAQLVASLHGDITEVLEAVKDFDNYKVQSNETEVETEEHLNEKTMVDSSDFVSTEKPNPTWSFTGIVDEIDEEIWNYDDEGRSLAHLDEVVVHKFDPSTKPGSMLEKVTGVLRKISSGSEPSSRRISGKDSSEKKTGLCASESQNRISYQTVQATDMRSDSHNTVADKDQRVTVNPISRNSSQTFCGSDNESSGNEGGKTRKKLQKPAGRSVLARNLSLDQNTLADFLKVLDDVQERLADDDCFHPSSTHEEASNYGFVASPMSSPPIARHAPHRRNRNRKLGIFDPEFNYFSPDLTGVTSKGRERGVQMH